MQLSIRRLIDPALTLVGVASIALLVIPWKEASLPPVASGLRPEVRKPQSELLAAERSAPPDAIVLLFSGKQAPRPTAAMTSAPQRALKPAAAAPWLRYMGRSSAADGKSYVYVKDSKSGKVIRAAQEEALNGWTLVLEDEAGLVLKNGEDLYAVSKR